MDFEFDTFYENSVVFARKKKKKKKKEEEKIAKPQNCGPDQK